MTVDERLDTGAIYALTASGDGMLFAARASGLYRSEDGSDWQPITVEDATNYIVTAVATSSKTVLAGTNGAIIRSGDGGMSFSLIGMARPAPLVTALALSSGFEADGFAIAGTAEDGVFVSEDGGITWVPWNYGLIDLDVHAVVISPNFAADKTVFAAVETGLYRSRNAGRSWQRVDFPDEQTPVLALCFYAEGLYAGSEGGGLLRSVDNGVSWRVIDLGEWQGKAINQLVATDTALYVLIEDALLRLGSNLSDVELVQSFPQRAPLTLYPHQDKWLIGFAEGELISLNAQ